GHWLILDEINLASIDILQRLIPILNREDENMIKFNHSSDLKVVDNSVNNNTNFVGSNKEGINLVSEEGENYLIIPEKGNENIKIHPRFRLFSCMNPPILPIEDSNSKSKNRDILFLNTKTTSGKKELPQLIRSLYTEYFVDELSERKDLEDIVYNNLKDLVLTSRIKVSLIVDIYLELKRLGNTNEITIGVEGNGHGIPNYSLRTFTNCLNYMRRLLILQNNWRKNQNKIKIIEAINNEKEIKSGDSIIQNNILKMDILEVIYNGIMMSFATPLTNESHKKVDLLTKRMLNFKTSINANSSKNEDERLNNYILFSAPKVSNNKVENEKYLLINNYIISMGNNDKYNFKLSDNINNEFILTPYVLNNMNMILRILSGSRNAILIEGETSTGKTSLIKYISKLTNHKFVRINNHEHTDIEEYFGRYIPNNRGELEFVEGPLINSIRNGYWLVLDELNLAPSEVLESLNRLLDSNRELYIPETGEVIKAHDDFQLFATQNPAGGIYGGRKLLSQAFRNRFIEIYFDEIPCKELEIIISKRCNLPDSYSQLMVKVYTELRRHRSNSQMFSGDYSFITVRDLLRWGNRLMCINNNVLDKNSLVITGFYVIGERIREHDEKIQLAQVLLNICKPIDIKDANSIINYSTLSVDNYINIIETSEIKEMENLDSSTRKKRRKEDNMDRGKNNSKISLNKLISDNSEYVLTDSFRRMITLVNDCIVYDEPVLLVGSTGCGKTSIFQLLSTLYGKQLYIINCHQQIETSDMLGSLRPVRSRVLRLTQELNNFIIELNHMSNVEIEIKNSTFERIHSIIQLINSSENNHCENYLLSFNNEIGKLMDHIVNLKANNNIENSELSILINKIKEEVDLYIDNVDDNRGLFEWKDGPIIKAMKTGNYVLLDEINLCDDSVIERLNSLLEDNKVGGGTSRNNNTRIIHLTEKGCGEDDIIIKSHKDFRIFATMNPSGDYGKRELSPALRNRFNEIFIPSLSIYKLRYDIKKLVIKRVAKLLNNIENKELIDKLSECLIMFSILYENDVKKDSILEISKDRLKDEDCYFRPLIENKVNVYINNNNIYLNNEDSEISEFTIRDILSWCDFINNNYENVSNYYIKNKNKIENYINVGNSNEFNLILEILIINELIVQGANMLIIDGLCGDLNNDKKDHNIGTNYNSLYLEYNMRLINIIVIVLVNPLLNNNKTSEIIMNLLVNRFITENGLNWIGSGEIILGENTENTGSYNREIVLINEIDNNIEVGPFYVRRKTANIRDKDNKLNFTFESKTTLRNMSSIIRSMSISKPILLQGSPGIGKTAIILTLSKIVGVNLHRINMSEQTDFSDLFGCEVPINKMNNDKECANKGNLINWMDGILLHAMKNGDWVILDELNLATQQILEGLNSIMDHRRNIYIPEIGQTIVCHESFRIFATQNPVKTGNSGRKRLPQSFLNRFIKININKLNMNDYCIICNHLFGNNRYITKELIQLCIEITRNIQLLGNNKTFNSTNWEWNLRDIIRLLRFIQLNINMRIENVAKDEGNYNDEVLIVNILYNSFESVYLSRMKNTSDYNEMNKLILSNLIDYLNIEQDKKIINSIEDNILKLNKTFLDYLRENVVLCHYNNKINSDCGKTIFNNSENQNNVLIDLNVIPLREKRYIYNITESVILGENVILNCTNSNDMELMVKYIKLVSKHVFEDVRVNVVNILFSLDANDLIGNYQQYNNTVILNEINELLLSLKVLDSSNNDNINISLMDRLKMKKLQNEITSNIEYNEHYYSNVNEYIKMLNNSDNISIIKEIKLRLEKLKVAHNANVDENNGNETGPNFQYMYSTIIDSIKKGEWLVINNINNCSSALLDRLNSLLEDKENDLFIIESGVPEYIKRDKRFRLFLINNGSIHNNYISNALINRCIEINIDFEFHRNNSDIEYQIKLDNNEKCLFYVLCNFDYGLNCKLCTERLINHIIYNCKCYNRLVLDRIQYESNINSSGINDKLYEIVMIVSILIYGINNYLKENIIIHSNSIKDKNECLCTNKILSLLLSDKFDDNKDCYNEHIFDIIDKKPLFIGWMNNLLLNSIIVNITNKFEDNILKTSLIELFEQYGLIGNNKGRLFQFYLDIFDTIYNDFEKIRMTLGVDDFSFYLKNNKFLSSNNLISEIYKDKSISKYDHLKEDYRVLLLSLMEIYKNKDIEDIHNILSINYMFSLYMKDLINEYNFNENIIFLKNIETIDHDGGIYSVYVNSIISTISSIYNKNYNGKYYDNDMPFDINIIHMLRKISIINNYDETYNKLLCSIYRILFNPLIQIDISNVLNKIIKDNNVFIYSLNINNIYKDNKSQECFYYSLRRYFNNEINSYSFDYNSVERELYNKLIHYSNYFDIEYIKKMVIDILKTVLMGIEEASNTLLEEYTNILELIELLIYNVLVLNESIECELTPKIILDTFSKLINKGVYIEVINILLLKLRSIKYDKINNLKMMIDNDVKIIPKDHTYIKTIYNPNNYVGDGIIINYENLMLQENIINSKEINSILSYFLNKNIKITDILRFFTHIRLCNLEFLDYIYNKNTSINKNKWEKVLIEANSLNCHMKSITEGNNTINGISDESSDLGVLINVDYYIHIKYVIYIIEELIFGHNKDNVKCEFYDKLMYYINYINELYFKTSNEVSLNHHYLSIMAEAINIISIHDSFELYKDYISHKGDDNQTLNIDEINKGQKNVAYYYLLNIKTRLNNVEDKARLSREILNIKGILRKIKENIIVEEVKVDFDNNNNIVKNEFLIKLLLKYDNQNSLLILFLNKIYDKFVNVKFKNIDEINRELFNMHYIFENQLVELKEDRVNGILEGEILLILKVQLYNAFYYIDYVNNVKIDCGTVANKVCDKIVNALYKKFFGNEYKCDEMLTFDLKNEINNINNLVKDLEDKNLNVLFSNYLDYIVQVLNNKELDNIDQSKGIMSDILLKTCIINLNLPTHYHYKNLMYIDENSLHEEYCKKIKTAQKYVSKEIEWHKCSYYHHHNNYEDIFNDEIRNNYGGANVIRIKKEENELNKGVGDVSYIKKTIKEILQLLLDNELIRKISNGMILKNFSTRTNLLDIGVNLATLYENMVILVHNIIYKNYGRFFDGCIKYLYNDIVNPVIFLLNSLIYSVYLYLKYNIESVITKDSLFDNVINIENDHKNLNELVLVLNDYEFNSYFGFKRYTNDKTDIKLWNLIMDMGEYIFEYNNDFMQKYDRYNKSFEYENKSDNNGSEMIESNVNESLVYRNDNIDKFIKDNNILEEFDTINKVLKDNESDSKYYNIRYVCMRLLEVIILKNTSKEEYTEYLFYNKYYNSENVDIDIWKFVLLYLNKYVNKNTDLNNNNMKIHIESEYYEHVINSNEYVKFSESLNIISLVNRIKLIDKLNELVFNIKKLLVEYVDQPLLILIKDVVDKIFEINLSQVNVNDLICYLDILLQRLIKWNEYIKEGVNINIDINNKVLFDYIEYVKNAIYQVRKLQINSWLSILCKIYKKYNYKSCFSFGDVLILISKIINYEEFNYVLVYNALIEYLKYSTIGEFPLRLLFIKYLRQLIKRENNNERINKLFNILSTIIGVYDIVYKRILINNTIELKNVVREIKDIIKLSLWDVRDYIKIKKNIMSTQRQLKKVLNNYDERLMTTVDKLSDNKENLIYLYPRLSEYVKEDSNINYIIKELSNEDNSNKMYKQRRYRTLIDSDIYNGIERLNNVHTISELYYNNLEYYLNKVPCNSDCDTSITLIISECFIILNKIKENEDSNYYNIQNIDNPLINYRRLLSIGNTLLHTLIDNNHKYNVNKVEIYDVHKHIFSDLNNGNGDDSLCINIDKLMIKKVYIAEYINSILTILNKLKELSVLLLKKEINIGDRLLEIEKVNIMMSKLENVLSIFCNYDYVILDYDFLDNILTFDNKFNFNVNSVVFEVRNKVLNSKLYVLDTIECHMNNKLIHDLRAFVDNRDDVCLKFNFKEANFGNDVRGVYDLLINKIFGEQMGDETIKGISIRLKDDEIKAKLRVYGSCIDDEYDRLLLLSKDTLNYIKGIYLLLENNFFNICEKKEEENEDCDIGGAEENIEWKGGCGFGDKSKEENDVRNKDISDDLDNDDTLLEGLMNDKNEESEVDVDKDNNNAIDTELDFNSKYEDYNEDGNDNNNGENERDGNEEIDRIFDDVDLENSNSKIEDVDAGEKEDKDEEDKNKRSDNIETKERNNQSNTDKEKDIVSKTGENDEGEKEIKDEYNNSKDEQCNDGDGNDEINEKDANSDLENVFEYEASKISLQEESEHGEDSGVEGEPASEFELDDKDFDQAQEDRNGGDELCESESYENSDDDIGDLEREECEEGDIEEFKGSNDGGGNMKDEFEGKEEKGSMGLGDKSEDDVSEEGNEADLRTEGKKEDDMKEDKGGDEGIGGSDLKAESGLNSSEDPKMEKDEEAKPEKNATENPLLSSEEEKDNIFKKIKEILLNNGDNGESGDAGEDDTYKLDGNKELDDANDDSAVTASVLDKTDRDENGSDGDDGNSESNFNLEEGGEREDEVSKDDSEQEGGMERRELEDDFKKSEYELDVRDQDENGSISELREEKDRLAEYDHIKRKRDDRMDKKEVNDELGVSDDKRDDSDVFKNGQIVGGDDSAKVNTESGIKGDDHFCEGNNYLIENNTQDYMNIWNSIQNEILPMVNVLTNQLRIILEPTIRGKMEGSYKTGKKLSMKKVVGYIASEYRKDRMWLRRSKPSKREFNILMCIDNSHSMSTTKNEYMALQSLFMIIQSLQKVEAGNFGVCSFAGDNVRQLVDMTNQIGSRDALNLLRCVNFKEESKDSHQNSIPNVLKYSTDLLHSYSNSGGNGVCHQLIIIITDGRFNKNKVNSCINYSIQKKCIPVLIIIDNRDNNASSIFDMKSVVKDENGNMTVKPTTRNSQVYYVS
ncbi:hypothetical protein FG386_001111, partial [Cryptosporidium ryanae]|uniref:uncharacterized protein n=1 Tax=Cryptosporidium ryanae TaxID=515981 RepID=UPI00351A1F04